MRRTGFWNRGQGSAVGGQEDSFQFSEEWFPSAVSGQQSAVSNQRSERMAVGGQQSAVSSQRSERMAVSNQKEWQSAVSSQRSAVSGQQSAVSNQKEWQSAVSSIRGRDREIAPTKSGRRSWVFLSSIPFYFFIEKTTEIRGFVSVSEITVWVHVV